MTLKNRLWILMSKRLSGSSTAEEDQELDELFKNDPEAWYSYEVLRATEVQDPVPDAFIDEIRNLLATDEPVTEVRKRPLFRRTWFVLSAAAMLLAAVSITWLLLAKSPASAGVNEIVAQNGTNTEVTLPDGTTAKLNAGSRLSYPRNFSSRRIREVTLSGEAYFKVTHDKEHPFVIHTASVDIHDLGTIFNVKAYPDEKTAVTTLIEGSVSVALRNGPASQKITLKPNEKLTYYKQEGASGGKNESSGRFEVSAITPTPKVHEFVETAWINNKLIFNNETFADLAKRMERRYNLEIVFTDEKIKETHLSGIFIDESIEEAMKILNETLKQTAPFRYTLDQNKLTIGSH